VPLREPPTGGGGTHGAIEEPEVIAKILAHLAHTSPDQDQSELPLGARVPPLQSSLI